jgi:hypothetical protein
MLSATCLRRGIAGSSGLTFQTGSTTPFEIFSLFSILIHVENFRDNFYLVK